MDAIIVKNLSKKYSLSKERPILLKNLFIPQKKKEVWALKDVSFSIKKGECIGIIGENGSGKSTLLKLISGIAAPTKGSIKVNGKVASLIELGAGFHPDLTGKENIYLNGTLLGFTKKEIDEKYKEIVEFADVEEYINQPVRTYSSGMVVRLGFSVAIHQNPDILLIDEVLAVGDIAFQGKCIGIIKEFKKQDKTIFFVSHSLEEILKISDKVLLFAKGKIKKSGDPNQVSSYYFKELKIKNIIKKDFNFINGVKIIKVNLKNVTREGFINSNEILEIEVLLGFTENIKETHVGYIIRDEINRMIMATNTYAEGIVIGDHKKGEKISVNFEIKIPLKRGKYYIEVHCFPEPNSPKYFDLIENAHEFIVVNKKLFFTPLHITPKVIIKEYKNETSI